MPSRKTFRLTYGKLQAIYTIYWLLRSFFKRIKTVLAHVQPIHSKIHSQPNLKSLAAPLQSAGESLLFQFLAWIIKLHHLHSLVIFANNELVAHNYLLFFKQVLDVRFQSTKSPLVFSHRVWVLLDVRMAKCFSIQINQYQAILA